MLPYRKNGALCYNDDDTLTDHFIMVFFSICPVLASDSCSVFDLCCEFRVAFLLTKSLFELSSSSCQLEPVFLFSSDLHHEQGVSSCRTSSHFMIFVFENPRSAISEIFKPARLVPATTPGLKSVKSRFCLVCCLTEL